MNRSRLRLAAVFAVLAMAVSACGGGGDATSVSLEGEGTVPGGSGPTGTVDVELGGGFDGSVQACGELSGAFAALVVGPAAALFGNGNGFEDLRKQLSGQTLRVPSELEGAFRVLDDAYAQIERDLEGVNLADAFADPDTQQRVAEASAVYDDPDVQAALDEVSAFIEANCTDFDLGDIVE